MRSFAKVFASVFVCATVLAGCGGPDLPSVERVTEVVKASYDVRYRVMGGSVTAVKITDLQCERVKDSKNSAGCSWKEEVHLDTRPDWMDQSKIVKQVKKASANALFVYNESKQNWFAL